MPRSVTDYHLLVKPAGAACNLGCRYCFFLSKEHLYPGESPRMDEATPDRYLRQLMESSPGPQVEVSWQGGEPMLRGLGFFQHSVELAERYRKPHQRVLHTIQTNGTLIDDEWAALPKEKGCLVGLSIDGPRALHDAYRVSKRGEGTFDEVVRAWECLRRHDVDTNILCGAFAWANPMRRTSTARGPLPPSAATPKHATAGSRACECAGCPRCAASRCSLYALAHKLMRIAALASHMLGLTQGPFATQAGAV